MIENNNIWERCFKVYINEALSTTVLKCFERMCEDMGVEHTSVLYY